MNYRYAELLCSTIIFIDRLTKYCAMHYCLNNACVINNYISFEVTINYGISWGLFNYGYGISSYIITALTIIITLLLSYAIYKNMKNDKSGDISYALSKNKLVGLIAIIAGSLSNIVDRFIYGGVIDFIELSYNQWIWPVFNVADVAIVCGIGLILYDCYAHE